MRASSTFSFLLASVCFCFDLTSSSFLIARAAKPKSASTFFFSFLRQTALLFLLLPSISRPRHLRLSISDPDRHHPKLARLQTPTPHNTRVSQINPCWLLGGVRRCCAITSPRSDRGTRLAKEPTGVLSNCPCGLLGNGNVREWETKREYPCSL